MAGCMKIITGSVSLTGAVVASLAIVSAPFTGGLSLTGLAGLLACEGGILLNIVT